MTLFIVVLENYAAMYKFPGRFYEKSTKLIGIPSHTSWQKYVDRAKITIRAINIVFRLFSSAERVRYHNDLRHTCGDWQLVVLTSIVCTVYIRIKIAYSVGRGSAFFAGMRWTAGRWTPSPVSAPNFANRAHLPVVLWKCIIFDKIILSCVFMIYKKVRNTAYLFITI